MFHIHILCIRSIVGALYFGSDRVQPNMVTCRKTDRDENSQKCLVPSNIFVYTQRHIFFFSNDLTSHSCGYNPYLEAVRGYSSHRVNTNKFSLRGVVRKKGKGSTGLQGSPHIASLQISGLNKTDHCDLLRNIFIFNIFQINHQVQTGYLFKIR